MPSERRTAMAAAGVRPMAGSDGGEVALYRLHLHVAMARSAGSRGSISVELHVWTEVKEVPWQGRWRAPRETGAWMRGLLAHGGYALVDRHDNPMCSYCSEVVLARLLEPRPGPLSQSQRRSRLRSQRRRRMRQARNATFTEADEAPATFLSMKMHAGFAQQAST